MRLRKLVFFVVAVLTLALTFPVWTNAQVNTVNLSGTVLDPQGLAVKNAKVTLTSTATGAARGTTSDANGRYEMIGLAPGTKV